jgi:hypothetical protein
MRSVHLTRPAALRGGMLVLTAAALAAFSGSARADNLDVGIHKNAAKIMDEVKKAGWKNVGVLKFMMQKDEAKPSLAFGEFNTTMANRLENALILVNDERNPVNITSNSGAVLAKSGIKSSYVNQATARKLFDLKYPLAWGNQTVNVDAFLTGVVHMHLDGPKKGTTTVHIKAIDKKSATPRELLAFDVKTDRDILSDTQSTFALRKATVTRIQKRQLFGDQAENEANQEAVQDAGQADQNSQGDVTQAADQTPVNQPDFSQYLTFKVLYNGQPAPGDSMHIAKPQLGQNIEFFMRANERVAVVVRVNGLNTLRMEKDKGNAQEYSMWVLEPNQDYKIRGFYPDAQTVLAFKATPPEQASPDFFDPNKMYHIDVDVFAAGPPVQAGESTPQIVERRMSLRSPVARGLTLEDTKKKVQTAMRKTPTRRNLIMPGDQGQAALETTTFDNPIHVGHWVVMYNKEGEPIPEEQVGQPAP